MTGMDIKIKVHPAEAELAGFLSHSVSDKDKKAIEAHIASCDECLMKIVSAYEAVEEFRREKNPKKKKGNPMKKINIYLILAILSFALSFITPRYFIQLLVATLLLGIKWIVDAKSTRMLVMIHEAWKKGGEKEAGRMLETLDSRGSKRL